MRKVVGAEEREGGRKVDMRKVEEVVGGEEREGGRKDVGRITWVNDMIISI